MKTILEANKIQYKPQGEEEYEQESTFITGGCENPNVQCENW